MPSQQPAPPSVPYREVPYRAEDAKKVLIFFSFSCPICANYHAGLVQWAKTLPKGWTAEFVPVAVPDSESVISTRAYYAAKAADPARLDDFVQAVYANIHEKRMNPAAPATWRQAQVDAGVSGFHQAWVNEDKGLIHQAFKKLRQYRVQETPSVAIGGRYVITPDNTNGDIGMFFQLANGMVSKAMTGR